MRREILICLNPSEEFESYWQSHIVFIRVLTDEKYVCTILFPPILCLIDYLSCILFVHMLSVESLFVGK